MAVLRRSKNRPELAKQVSHQAAGRRGARLLPSKAERTQTRAAIEDIVESRTKKITIEQFRHELFSGVDREGQVGIQKEQAVATA